MDMLKKFRSTVFVVLAGLCVDTLKKPRAVDVSEVGDSQDTLAASQRPPTLRYTIFICLLIHCIYRIQTFPTGPLEGSGCCQLSLATSRKEEVMH